MQDEINEKSVVLAIRTGKLTAKVLQQAIKLLLKKGKGQLTKTPHGKQTLRQLMKQNAGVSNIEITDGNIKALKAQRKNTALTLRLKRTHQKCRPAILSFSRDGTRTC